MKKIASAFLFILLVCLAASGAALTATGLETETVSRSWETNAFFPRMEALTGIHVEAKAVDIPADYAKMLDAMASGEIPADMLFKAALSRADEQRLLDSGAIIDLSTLIDENMPNLSTLLDAHPEWRKSISLPDGRIASLPLLNEQERQVAVWINAEWLEKLNLPLPQSVAELTDTLYAFTQKDPNGNGGMDERGADVVGVWEMRWLLPYFGIVADDYNLARNADGQLVFAPELPAYREFVQLLADWVQKGILTDDAFLSLHSTAVLNEQKEDAPIVSGLIISPAPYTTVPAGATQQYKALLMPDDSGEIVWRDLLGEVWTGCFAVTSACKEPAEALRWVDALYAEPGALLAYAGEEGTDYEYNKQGYWNFILSALRDVNNIRQDAIIYTGTATPGISPAGFLAKVDSEADRYVLAENARVKAVATRPISDIQGQPNRERADALNQTLAALVDTGIARFATGETPLDDEHWDAWLAELRENGSAELVTLFDADK